MPGSRVASRLGLRFFAVGYLSLLLLIPIGMIFYRAFEHGAGAAWDAVTTADALHAFYLTILIAAIAVAANTIFGIGCALLLVRTKFRGKALLNAAVDLPFAISPVVIGLSLYLLYGREGWFGGWLLDNGIQILFSLPGMVLATIFVSLPFVVREVVPVLHEIGDEQEQAAQTLGANWWQTFRRITLPAIRWGVAYGVVLATARALGEFGAVAVVSGRVGQTETAPLWVWREFGQFNLTGAYTASLVLALIAIATLLAMNGFKRKEAA
jgi:sulfate/thiosulfate transport system permease protein